MEKKTWRNYSFEKKNFGENLEVINFFGEKNFGGKYFNEKIFEKKKYLRKKNVGKFFFTNFFKKIPPDPLPTPTSLLTLIRACDALGPKAIVY